MPDLQVAEKEKQQHTQKEVGEGDEVTSFKPQQHANFYMQNYCIKPKKTFHTRRVLSLAFIKLKAVLGEIVHLKQIITYS